MKRSRQFTLVTLLLLVAIVLSGCSFGKSKPAATTTFRVAKPWDRTGIRNHYHSGSNIGALEWFSVEPLVQYVRSTDELHYLLAEEIKHYDDHTSVIKVRKDAKWHTGEKFAAEDVAAYFHINFVAVTNYLAKPMEVLDEHSVKLTWKSWMEPNDTVKTLLLAEHKAGSVQYSLFKEYVDRAQEILTSQERAPEGYTGWAPFGYKNSLGSEEEYNENYLSFRAVNPETFVATGPYKLEKVTQNQMVLVKNENYYFADNVKFDQILASNVADITNIYNMLTSNELDYQDGVAPEATLNAILNNNKDMVHFKMFDPGAIGLVFNLEKRIWTDPVREAFQYLFDREEMRNAGNKYAVTSYYPLIGMAPSEAETWMNPEDFKRIPKYDKNLAKATELLKQAGWSQIEGRWYDQNNQLVELSLGYDGSHPGMSGVAEAASSALEKFGIKVVLKRASDFGAWFDTAKAKESVYDFVVNWTDLNMSFSYPTGSFNYVLFDINGPIMHLGEFTAEDLATGLIEGNDIGNLRLVLNKADGSGKFVAYKYLTQMYSMSEEILEEALADLVFGLAEVNYGVQFYQNVTGSFLNAGTLANLPLKEYVKESRNVTYVPEVGTEDFYTIARTNLIYSQGIPFKNGDYEPK